ncbi:MAG: hypothetical protein KF812_08620 [Fimbriimonadaceae bacterium]|nr:hypothetical protein [Fimbriimonadaceae bacterium]
MIATILATIAIGQTAPRFQFAAPLPITPVRIDARLAKVGIAQEMAARHKWQARLLWVDATANLGRVNSAEKIAALVDRAKAIGFNTIVFDVKPIVGRTMYPSQYADRLLAWRTDTMPADFDPLAVFVKETDRAGLDLFVSLNAFSEGHLYAKQQQGANPPFGAPGWGYEHPELQSVELAGRPVVRHGDQLLTMNPTANPAEFDTDLALYTQKPSGEMPGPAVMVDIQNRVTVAATYNPPAGRMIVGKGAGAEYLLSLPVGTRMSVTAEHEFRRSSEGQTQIPLMMNPHSRAVKDRALGFIDEITRNYAVDAVLYDDRLRFGGIEADFSPEARAAFEKHVGRQLRWPEDVYSITYTNDLKRGLRPGRFYDTWMAWRASVMAEFVGEVRRLVARNRPTTQFGVYAGSFFGDYPRVGVNYASPELVAGYPFLTRAYRDQGFANQIDMLITGCYYRMGTIEEAMRRGESTGVTVEAGGIMSNRLANDHTWTYAGLMLATFEAEPERLELALQGAAATTQGIMVFDLSHNFDKFAPILERAFRTPTIPPHRDQENVRRLRETRRIQYANGYRPPPVPFFEGAAGTGW